MLRDFIFAAACWTICLVGCIGIFVVATDIVAFDFLRQHVAQPEVIRYVAVR